MSHNNYVCIHAYYCAGSGTAQISLTRVYTCILVQLVLGCTMVSIKITYCSSYCREVRRFSLDDPTSISFAKFKTKIATLFHKDEAQVDKEPLRYQNKDGDFVSVYSDEELREAFRQLGEKDDDTSTVRFHVGESACPWLRVHQL